MITFEANMKYNFFRMIVGLLIIGIALGIADIFSIDWLDGGNNIGFIFILSIAYVGSWGIWNLYKKMKREKE